MRKRKNENSIVRKYAYRVWFKKEMIPESFWQQAKEMNNLWNELCKLRVNKFKPEYDKQKETIGNMEKEDRKTLYPLLKELTNNFEYRDCPSLTKNGNDLGWEAREYVLQTFLAAHKLAMKTYCKTKGKHLCVQPCPKHGHVHPKTTLNAISVYHRFSAGGVEPQKIFTSKSNFWIREPNPTAYENESVELRKKRVRDCKLRLGNKGSDILDFRVVLNREIPPETKIKTVILNGKKPTYHRDWEWQLLLTLEIPLNAQELQELKPACGLDIGWRVMSDYLRLGIINDTQGNIYELRLPFDVESNQEKRKRAWLESQGIHKENQANYIGLVQLQQKSDNLLNEAIQKLLDRGLDDTTFSWYSNAPDEIKEMLQTPKKIRQTGLLKLLSYFENILENEPNKSVGKFITTIKEWQEDSFPIGLERTLLQEKLIRHRNYIYKNIAAWLYKNFSYIVWEGDLSLNQMARQAADTTLCQNPALFHARKWRQWAGLYKLRESVKNKDIYGNRLIKEKAAGTTSTCHVKKCGAHCEPTAQLMVECEKGHKEDQDIRAAKNLLSKLPDDLLLGKREIAIPDNLKGYVVKIN